MISEMSTIRGTAQRRRVAAHEGHEEILEDGVSAGVDGAGEAGQKGRDRKAGPRSIPAIGTVIAQAALPGSVIGPSHCSLQLANAVHPW